MHPRIDTTHVNQDAYKAMLGLQSYVDATGLEQSLRYLIMIRASQINGCAFCLHMHFRDARKAGEVTGTPGSGLRLARGVAVHRA